MAMIVWSNDYRVGVESLDKDHILIFSLINHIHEAHESGSDERAVSTILEVLLEVAFGHFRREEALMRKHGYDELDAHAAEHRELMERLQPLHDAYRERPHHEISREIIEILAFWLEVHILETDMHYRPALKGVSA